LRFARARDAEDVADSVFNILVLGAAVMMVLYGVIEGSQALWPMVA
jgi:tetrahydromethanopterin S-methyltransferase subunit H